VGCELAYGKGGTGCAALQMCQLRVGREILKNAQRGLQII